jgi:probable phosphoglycerate mutase
MGVIMKLYVVRHGETEWNALGKMQGWKDSPLSEKGVLNAQRLGQRLSQIDFDFVCCSPLGRTSETAKHILGNRETNFSYNSAFQEMGFGAWEGMYHDEIKNLYPTQQHNYWNAPHLYETNGGETYEIFIDRVKNGLDGLIQSSSFNNVLLVTHAAVIKAIFAIVYKRDLMDFWSPPFTYDTCLSILEVENGELRVLMEPDISHLEA